MTDVLIRNYKDSDRDFLRKLCCDTAFMGQPLEVFFDDRELVADILTSYYTDYEPEATFIAQSAGKIVGYLAGCKDTPRKEKIVREKVLPKVFTQFLRKRIILNKKNSEFIGNAVNSFFSDDFNWRKVPKDYPAHLHINVREDARRSGAGAKLMATFINYLKQNNITGVHLHTFSETGKNFFIKSGFKLLWETKTSQWRYLLQKDISVYTFAKKLEKPIDF